MDIMPAVDIRGGNAVRLVQGNYDKETVFGSPKHFAQEWVRQGTSHLHLVDLDGAKAGYPVNLELVNDIVNHCDAKVQLGGGLRSLESIKSVVDLGVSRFIVGTAAISDRELQNSLFQLISGENLYRYQVGWRTPQLRQWIFSRNLRKLAFSE